MSYRLLDWTIQQPSQLFATTRKLLIALLPLRIGTLGSSACRKGDWVHDTDSWWMVGCGLIKLAGRVRSKLVRFGLVWLC